MRRPWFAHLKFTQFIKRLYHAFIDNGVADSAAILSYYFAFSVFPFLFFLVTLMAYMPFVSSATSTLLSRARGFVPGPAMALVTQHVHDLVSKPRPHLLGIGIVVTLYSASRGVDAVRRALNLAYDVKESRPLWKTELIAFGTTAGGAFLVLLTVAALLAGGQAGYWIAHHFHVAEEYQVASSWARWPVTALVIICAGSARLSGI